MAAILMIDDEQAILELVKNGLQKDGHFVTAYTSAAQVPLYPCMMSVKCRMV